MSYKSSLETESEIGIWVQFSRKGAAVNPGSPNPYGSWGMGGTNEDRDPGKAPTACTTGCFYKGNLLSYKTFQPMEGPVRV